MLCIIVCVKEEEIQMEGNKAEKYEHEFVLLDEKDMTFYSVGCVCY